MASAMPPEHYEAAVARAVELIGAGEMEKIVLAREVQVHAPRAYDPAAVVGVLREEFPSCSVFCVGRGDATLVAASVDRPMEIIELTQKEGCEARPRAIRATVCRE